MLKFGNHNCCHRGYQLTLQAVETFLSDRYGFNVVSTKIHGVKESSVIRNYDYLLYQDYC